MKKQVSGQTDLFEALDEAENGPPPCPHNPTVQTGGWTLEHNPKSPYFWEWVHGHPDCRRSKFPGRKHNDGP